MNGFASPYGQPQPGAAAAAAWQEHHTADGRAYYYNSATKVTQWTKPEDLMTSGERALATQPWKEYSAEGGRKYWYNTETKQSSWEMPEAYKSALGATSGQSTPAPQTHSTQNGSFQNASYDQPRDTRDVIPESRQLGYGSDPKVQAFVPATNDPEYSSFEEAEAAFMKMLKRNGVQSDWTWVQAMRANLLDPQWRSLKDFRERHLAFEKYCQDSIVQDKERAKERMTKLRADFETMLKRHPEIVHYTRWKTARPIIEGETIFRSTDNEEERRQLFEEYIITLQQAHREQEASLRKDAMDGLVELLPKLDIGAYTRWFDAQDMIHATSEFKQEKKYSSLNKLDILTAFQNHIKSLERVLNEKRQEDKKMKYREERKNRDAYKELLNSLRKQGKINSGTKWDKIFPSLENDERYRNMLGQQGSTTMELFWDIVEDEERALRIPKNEVVDVLEDKRFELTSSSDLEEFLSIMKDDRRTANINRDTLTLIFERLREKRASKRDDDRHSDRPQRRAIDDFRLYLKRVEPPIAASDTYEKVRPRLLKSEEFQAITSEEARQTAFDRHMRRVREKEDEADRPRRRGDRGSSERDSSRRERDRSRGERSHRPSGRAARRSRSPEPDPYEADRRKAIAERERNHRKSTMAENVLANDRSRLSPPPRHKRERDYDHPSRPRRDDDIDRRDRDEDRPARRRIDRGSYDELPYGDERPSASRRRRADDEDDYARRDSRDSKRTRRERSRERTPPRDGRHRNRSPPPAAAPPPKEKVKDKGNDIQSGSEEGEIEE